MTETANVAMFAATMLHSATNTHFFHWSTDSFSKHMALGSYYDEIVPLVDDLVEAYMGCYEQIKTFPSVYHQPKEAVKYLESLKSFVDDARQDLPKESQIQNIVDEIAQLIDSTCYKLKYLK
jgi:DNA-binding ferritin-like protein